MILSHKFRFIFIKTKKVAGTSFEIGVSPFLGADDVVTPLAKDPEEIRRSVSPVTSQNFRTSLFNFTASDYVELARNTNRFLRAERKPEYIWPRQFYNHMPAKLVRDRIPDEIWTSYHKFTIERNPWDKAVSHYFHFARHSDISFRDYVLSGGAYRALNYDIYCIDGVPALDEVIRYEALADGISTLSERIGFPGNINDQMNAIRAYSQFRSVQDYRDMYDDETRQLIAIQFAQEIELFGYEF